MLTNYSSPSLAAFATLAEAFCDQMAAPDSGPEELLTAAHRFLPQLYLSALQLPSTSVLFADESSPEDDANPEEFDVSEAPAPTALPVGLFKWGQFLGLRRYYREIFDPYSENTEGEVVGDLIDDLGDVYRDLMAGLVQWRMGNTGEALWEWRFRFEFHWGEHATSSLRATFALSAWHDAPWPVGDR
jgi:hypothetical protein